jgi:hypothetical protein
VLRDPVEPTREPLIWRVHPARSRLVATLLTIVVIASAAVLSAGVMGHPLWGVFAIAVLTLPLARFLLPTEFVIDEIGITARTVAFRQQLRWSEARRFDWNETSGHVSTRARPSVLDGFRGVHLLFRTDAEAAIARIREEIANARRLEKHPKEQPQCAG